MKLCTESCVLVCMTSWTSDLVLFIVFKWWNYYFITIVNLTFFAPLALLRIWGHNSALQSIKSCRSVWEYHYMSNFFWMVYEFVVCMVFPFWMNFLFFCFVIPSQKWLRWKLIPCFTPVTNWILYLLIRIVLNILLSVALTIKPFIGCYCGLAWKCVGGSRWGSDLGKAQQRMPLQEIRVPEEILWMLPSQHSLLWEL